MFIDHRRIRFILYNTLVLLLVCSAYYARAPGLMDFNGE